MAVALLAALPAVGTYPAAAGGLRDLADAWLIPRAAVADLMAGGEAASGGWSVSVGQGRLFDLDELPQLGLAIGRRWPRLACRLRWERLGGSLYREDLGRLELLVGGRWRTGAEVGVDRLALAGGEPRTLPAADLRIRGRLGERLLLDIWWPLTDAPPWYGRQGLRRWLRLSAGEENWACAAVVDRQATGSPVCQGEVLLRLAPGVALGVRLEPWSGAAGLVTAWRLRSVLLRTSHLVHPDLGPTHRWSLDLGVWP